MPAVRATLGCLIPEEWHPRLDKVRERRRKGAGAERVGVHLMADRWKVDVSEEASLGVPGRPITADVLEFFLKVSRRVCDKLELALAIGTIGLGRRIGMGESVERLCRTVEGWQSWGEKERRRVRGAEEFVIPVMWDPLGRNARDWVLVFVTPQGDGQQHRFLPLLRMVINSGPGNETETKIGHRFLTLL